MRITESRMRQIIREEAKRALQEMPYAGDLGISHSTDQESESFISSNLSAAGVNRKGAEKYARSGRFKTLAKRHFYNIPYNVWVAPLIGIGYGAGVNDDPEDGARGRVLDLVPDGIKLLERLKFEAPSRVGPDDLVIIHSISDVDRANLSSPWMIFHSMFDDQSAAPDNFIPSWYDLDFDGLTNNLKYNDGTTFGDDTSKLDRVLTMGSARGGLIQALGDVPGEAICQELLTKGGFRYKTEALDDEGIEAMEEFAAAVRVAADEFRQSTKGMLLAVATS